MAKKTYKKAFARSKPESKSIAPSNSRSRNSSVPSDPSPSSNSTASKKPNYVFGPKSAALKKHAVKVVPQGRTPQSQAASLMLKANSTNESSDKFRPRFILEVDISTRPVKTPSILRPSSPVTLPSALNPPSPNLPSPNLPSPNLPSPGPPSPGPPSPGPLSPGPPSPNPLSPGPPSPNPPSPVSDFGHPPPHVPSHSVTPSQSRISRPRQTPLFLDSDDDGPGAIRDDHLDEQNDINGVEDDAEAVLSGGRLSSSQISEIRDIVMKMHKQIEAKGKEWKRSTESLLRVGNVMITTKERRHGGNSWNAFQSTFEKDPEDNRPHSEYVEAVIKPAYDDLIENHGGVDSAEWKAKAEQLVEEHRSMKAAAAITIAQLPSDIGRAMKQTIKRWEDDLKWLATLNAHGMFIMVSGNPDSAASKYNSMVCGSKPMHDWATANLPIKSSLLPMIHSYIVSSQGQPLLQMKRTQPKDMHMMRKEIKDELQRLVLPLGSSIVRVPWGNLPLFFASHHIRVENWPPLTEFPALKDLAVDQIRTESWRSLWQAFFSAETSKRIKVLSLSALAAEDGGRLPDATVLVSDCFSRTLITTADVESDILGSGPSNTRSAPGLESLPSTSASGRHGSEDSGPARAKKRQRKHGEDRTMKPKRIRGSRKKAEPYKSLEFIDEDDRAEPIAPEEPRALDSTHSVPLDPLPDDVLAQLSHSQNWQNGMFFGMDDSLQSHLDQWADLGLGLDGPQTLPFPPLPPLGAVGSQSGLLLPGAEDSQTLPPLPQLSMDGFGHSFLL
jgi:hypothetical protein